MALRVPKEVTARIKRNLSASPVAAPAIPAGGERLTCLLLSWNIDGIDEAGPQDTMLRALAVAEHISATQPVAVLLQEVIAPQLELFSAPQVLGDRYEIVFPDNPSMCYYCAILLDKRRAKLVSKARTTHFTMSQMGRHFLSVDIVVDGQTGAPITCITTHLESTKPERQERVRQFSEVLREVSQRSSSSSYRSGCARTVVLAGDLNIRDDEVTEVRRTMRSTCPTVDDIVDAWLWCGSPKAHEFTWDTAQNTNLGVTYKSRCRFDRCFFLSPGLTKGAGAGGRFKKPLLSPTSGVWDASAFALVGRDKVEGLGRFPSDHWGMQVTFTLNGAASAGPAAATAEKVVAAEEPEPPVAAVAAEAPVASAGSGDSPAERLRKREIAAAKAEARLRAAAPPSTKRPRISGATDATATSFGALASASADAPAALAPATTSGVADAVQATALSAAARNAASLGAVAAPAPEDEDEEAMMARAIALSLEACGGGAAGIAGDAPEASAHAVPPKAVEPKAAAVVPTEETKPRPAAFRGLAGAGSSMPAIELD